ncbi:MAG: HAMP domain-containing protein [Proteobacteria bacterium]|nr:HAMP domain-containing protein [Pseudomonadota bacterium]MDE3207290.1 HAMP domain-containing protein [Pseudomonadota bacterium]
MKVRPSSQFLLRSSAYYPSTFFKLLIIAFFLVAAPLIVALLNSVISIDRLVNQSGQAVYQAALNAHASRMLVDDVTAMERSVRQAIIIGDTSLLDTYVLAHKSFLQNSQELNALPLTPEMRSLLKAMQHYDALIAATALKKGVSVARLEKIVGNFSPMFHDSDALMLQGNVLVEQEVNQMQATSATYRHILLWQLLALVPIALCLVAGFIVLIARPISQLEKEIRRMGRGELLEPVQVDGPQDIRHLGLYLENMRERLVNLEEQKLLFLRHVSHELKTPLATVRESAHLLSEEVVGPLTGEQVEVTQILIQNIQRLQTMIENLLNYSGLRNSPVVLAFKNIALDEVVRNVAGNQAILARKGGINLVLDLEPVTFKADEGKLATIVENLLLNALRFSPDKGQVIIRLHPCEGGVMLEVQDEGTGIADDEKEKVFDPFYQGRLQPPSHVQGTGLGLSLVREYVTAHRGRITILDGSPHGAHFKVFFPQPLTEK